MLIVLTVAVWAVILGLNPGLTLVAIAVSVLVLDLIDARIVDRFVAAAGVRAE